MRPPRQGVYSIVLGNNLPFLTARASTRAETFQRRAAVLAQSARSTATSGSGAGWLGRSPAPTPENLDEFAERLLVHVGNGDIGKVRVGPADDVVAVDRFDSACPTADALGVDRQLGHSDNVLVVSINKRRRGDPVHDGHASPYQGEALRREI